MKLSNIWEEDNSGSKGWDREGITGLYFPDYDIVLFISCAYLYGSIFPMIMSVYQIKYTRWKLYDKGEQKSSP